MGKPNRKGRNAQKQGRFVRLGHDLLMSDAFLSLTPNARSLLIVLISRYTKANGSYNNGEFWLSENDAAAMMGVASGKTARIAFSELSECGFIRMTKDRHWNIKAGNGRARCWRLTWEFNDLERKPASNEWQDHKPKHDSYAYGRMKRGRNAVCRYKKELSQKQKPPVNFTGTNSNSQFKAVKNTVTNIEDNEKPPKLPQSVQVNNTPHIAIPRGAVFDQSEQLRLMALGLDPFQQAA